MFLLRTAAAGTEHLCHRPGSREESQGEAWADTLPHGRDGSRSSVWWACCQQSSCVSTRLRTTVPGRQAWATPPGGCYSERLRGPRPRWPSSLTKQMLPLGASTCPWDDPLLAGLTPPPGPRSPPTGGGMQSLCRTQTIGKLFTAQSSHPSKRLWAFGAQMFGYFSIFKEKKQKKLSPRNVQPC